jgi:hypothetical protein
VDARLHPTAVLCALAVTLRDKGRRDVPMPAGRSRCSLMWHARQAASSPLHKRVPADLLHQPKARRDAAGHRGASKTVAGWSPRDGQNLFLCPERATATGGVPPFHVWELMGDGSSDALVEVCLDGHVCSVQTSVFGLMVGRGVMGLERPGLADRGRLSIARPMLLIGDRLGSHAHTMRRGPMHRALRRRSTACGRGR